MAGLNSFLKGWPGALRWLAYGALVGIFVWSVAFFYLPGQGFSYLIEFGTMKHDRYVPEVKAVGHYEAPNSPGYDSQFYVQIAMHPHLGDKVLRDAVDSLPYRARRILFLLTARVLGGGDPARVMNVYALQNVACWFLLAVVLLRWFPPTSWGNWVRWGAVLFSFGLIFSVWGALLDGPSLLLTAVGMALIESGRTWGGALVLGLSGLGKDTSVLCGSALCPSDRRSQRGWGLAMAQGAVVVLPVVAWMLFLRVWLGKGDDIGAHNFSLPFVGLVTKLGDALSSFLAERYPYPTVAKFDLLVMIGLVAQFLFFALRIRWNDPWWRVGASYALLMVFLGNAVWEHYPSAAARVLLPMTLAFNITLPRKGFWPILLVIGNLGVFGSTELLRPPGRESYRVDGPKQLQINPKDGGVVEAIYGSRNWWGPERSRWEYWRWSLGDCTIAVHNPQPFPVTADVRFRLHSADVRGATVRIGPKVVWSGTLDPSDTTSAVIPDLVLAPGDTVLAFTSDKPPAYPGNNDRRKLTFSIRGFEIDLKGPR